MDFTKTIWEYREEIKRPLLVAHRGMPGANIPCNTLAAFQIALQSQADVIEIDVAKTMDGKFYVFHPGTEELFLKVGKSIAEMTSDEVDMLRVLNDQDAKTSYPVPKLREVLSYLKGKCYINVDKYWTDIEGITSEIREAGVEKQVIIKTDIKEEYLTQIEKIAPDLMFMGMHWHEDQITKNLLSRNINYIGIECLFDKESDPICSEEYIRFMHNQKLLVWSNAIIYDEAAVISANRTDDRSLLEGPENGWGWLSDRGFDFIQTDWLPQCRNYFLQK